VQAPREEKSDDSKYSFYEELEQVCYHFPKYSMKTLLDFNAKVERENILKATIGIDVLQVYIRIVMIMVLE
jgi:hypothetical protein